MKLYTNMKNQVNYIEEQKLICEKYNSLYRPTDFSLNVGISDNLNLEPINGLRHSQQSGTSGWYIWTGEYSEREDFFKPLCAEHLIELLPQVVKYLGLDKNYRFLIDRNGYEDVWIDESLDSLI